MTGIVGSKAEQQLILFSAGTTVRRRERRVAAERLMEGINWPRLVKVLAQRRLLPVLGPRILELADGRATGPLPDAVKDAIDVGRRQGASLQLVSLRITAMLAEAGIRSSPLKGPLLGEAIYGDPGRRLSSDVDLLVSPDQLRAAVNVVGELGYSNPTDYVQACGLPLLHFTLVHKERALPPVELHWRVHWYERRFACERLLPAALGQPDDWRPDPADELAALLLFYARDGFVELRLASDLGAWWDIYGAELPAGALDELLLTYPELARAITVAAEVAEQTIGLPATQVIQGAHRRGLRERVAGRLANPNPRSSLSQLYADIGLIDGLLAPAGGFGAFIRRQVLPPPEVLEQQARFGGRRRRRSSIGRGAGVVARYGLTMTRLVRFPVAPIRRLAANTSVGKGRR